MTASILLQLLISGILLGTMYGIGAIGLSLIYGTMGILFIAQGTFIVLAAYGSFWLFRLCGMDPYVSIIIVVPASLILGVGLYQALFRKVAREGQFPTLLIAFGLMALVENLMSVLFTANPRGIQTTYSAYALTFLGLKVSLTRLIAFGLSVVATAVVAMFLKKTLLGKAVRAASENMEYATLMGITPTSLTPSPSPSASGLPALPAPQRRRPTPSIPFSALSSA